jgi:hypothetical protein
MQPATAMLKYNGLFVIGRAPSYRIGSDHHAALSEEYLAQPIIE